MISCIITTYNRPEKLKKAVDSVINQSYTDWELIIVNDGGEVPKVKHEKARVVNLEKNFGSDTRPKNVGILEAKGEYIAFLDDDNVWRPDHLQILFKEISRDPKLDLVYGDRWLIDDAKTFKPRLGISSDFDIAILLRRNFIDTSDVLVKRQAIIDVGGYDERYTKYVDWNLWVRMVKAGKKFLHTPMIVTDYHVHMTAKSQVGYKQTQNEKNIITRWGEQTNFPDWRLFTEKDIEVKNFSDFGQYELEVKLPYLGEIKEPRVAIYSLTYDRLELTKKCFESLYKTAGYPFDHFVVDNGSTDGTQEWLWKNEMPDRGKNIIVNTLINGENKGISIASNQAIDLIQKTNNYDIIVKVDNDAFFITPDWLKTMVRIWKSNHRLVMSPYVQGLRDNPGGAPRIGWGWIGGEYLGMTKHIGGIVHFVDADAYKEWRWSEDDFLHGVQDLEFSQWLLQHGYQMGYLENYFCETVTADQEKQFPEYFKRRIKEKQTKYEANRKSL
jgi:glycosyltransferase involved in cell wall biosynthesis